MPVPRLFISSTCYDLQEIRFQLKSFIEDLKYFPVLSEFNDVYYSYDSHVHDSCIEEVAMCQLFILIIGNNFGSFYHKNEEKSKIPDSVTLREFRKALQVKIHKHIFINKLVYNDYKNYREALDETILKYYQNNEISDETTEIASIKDDFDNKYYFTCKSYKYIFHFIDIIQGLKINNAIHFFEVFSEIKDSLKKQWASFMYEFLTRKNNYTAHASKDMTSKRNKKESLNKFIEGRRQINNNKIDFNRAEANIEDLEPLQDRIAMLLNDITTYEVWSDDGKEDLGQRIYFGKKFSNKMARNWLESLEKLVSNYKFSKAIQLDVLFKDYLLMSYEKRYSSVSYKTLSDLNDFYNFLDQDDKVAFINTVTQTLNTCYDLRVNE